MIYQTDYGPVNVGPHETKWLKWFDYSGEGFEASRAYARLVLRECERVAQYKAWAK